jgi:uncharacterized protein Yka (UPF0111/DUF47 family)
MISFQKLFGKGDQFFDLFENAAERCCDCVQALRKIVNDPTNPSHISELRRARTENKVICQKIDEMVVRTFVTILEREDIEALIGVLYRIPKPMEKFAERYLIGAEVLSPEIFKSQIEILDTATSTVAKMVKELRKGLNLAAIKELNSRLQHLEEEADHLELDLLRILIKKHEDPFISIFIKDLSDLLEKVVDRCRDTGGVITHIFLKNS